MSKYRIYRLDQADKIVAADNIECDTDEAAKNIAIAWAPDRDVEVWRGAERVAKLLNCTTKKPLSVLSSR